MAVALQSNTTSFNIKPTPELLAELEMARKEIREGNGVVCHTTDVLQRYLNSL